jgi:O-antigen ligase
MFKLKNNINQKKSGSELVEILFYIFPLSFLIGNLAISINILLFIIISLIFIKKNALSVRFEKSTWLIIIFFLYFFLSTSFQFLYPGFLNDQLQNFSIEINPILKSFLFIRFILLILILDTLLYNKIIDLKKFFLSSLICTSFVSFDVILQYITGVDLFGYKSFANWNSGPFGDELIAGSYLKNFSFFSLFFIFLNFKNKNMKNPLLIFIIASHLTAILVSGNRMPTILFLFGCFLLVLFIKNLRFSITAGVVIFIGIFLFLEKKDEALKQNYAVFFSDINISKIFNNKKIIKNNNSLNENSNTLKGTNKTAIADNIAKNVILLRHSGYYRVFKTSVLIWLEQPLTGFGLKSFRVKCWDILNKDNIKNNNRPQDISCGNHPHNYYLEILSEAGIVGFILIFSFFIFLLRNSFYTLKEIYKTNSDELIVLVPVMISIILEIWPLRSTGSFFTNTNATFFWLIVGMLISSNIKNSLHKY